MEMISIGVAAYDEFDPEVDEPEALVFAILYRAAAANRVPNSPRLSNRFL